MDHYLLNTLYKNNLSDGLLPMYLSNKVKYANETHNLHIVEMITLIKF